MFIEEGAVALAKIVKTFGSNGELAIRLYDTFPDEVDFQEPMFVRVNGLLVPFFLNSFNKRGVSKATIIFDDIDTEYRAMELVGQEILTLAGEPEDGDNTSDELFMEDLAGFDFVDTISSRRGKIVEFLDSEFNPLFLVEYDGEQYYIPAHDDLIIDIDSDSKVVELEVADGVFDINA